MEKKFLWLDTNFVNKCPCMFCFLESFSSCLSPSPFLYFHDYSISQASLPQISILGCSCSLEARLQQRRYDQCSFLCALITHTRSLCRSLISSKKKILMHHLVSLLSPYPLTLWTNNLSWLSSCIMIGFFS